MANEAQEKNEKKTVVNLTSDEMMARNNNTNFFKEEKDSQIKDVDLENKTTRVEMKKQEMREKFGNEGIILKDKKGGTIIIEKYLIASSGVSRIAYYDADGFRRVVNADRFENKIKKGVDTEKTYQTESVASVKRIKNLDKKYMELIDEISNVNKKGQYDKELESIVINLGKFIDIDNDNAGKEIVEKISPEDFFDIKEILNSMIIFGDNLKIFLKKIKKESEREQEYDRGKEFEKKYGNDVDYIYKEKINGHIAPTSGFILRKYILKDNKNKDRVEIEWHNDGKVEVISRRKFFGLLKKGFKRDVENKKDSKKKVDDESIEKQAQEGNEELDYEAKNNADKYRDEYFKEMSQKAQKRRGDVDTNKFREEDELVGDLELADKFKRESIDEKNFVNNKLETQLEAILRENPEIEKEVIRRTFDAETREVSYDKAELKDKILMLLGERSNQARKKYLEKDYDMDRRLGGMKRFFGKTFKIGNFEEEIKSYEEEYETAREKYKNAILELEGLNDREEAEILTRDFQISEQLRWRNDKLDIAIENNPVYENAKKFLLGAVDRYREMRRWPSNKISKLFGFKGLSKGVGIVSGMLITGKVLKEVGMVGNPAFRVFSVAVSSVGYKQILETVTEKKRIKKSEKEVKKAVHLFGADFESAKNIEELNRWLSDKNKNLSKDIQDEKYWRNWRTIMAGGMAMGTFFGGRILGEKIAEYFKESHNEDIVTKKIIQNQVMHNVEDNAVNIDKIKEEAEKFLGDHKIEAKEMAGLSEVQEDLSDNTNNVIIEEPFPLGVENGESSSIHTLGDENVEIHGAMEVKETTPSVMQDKAGQQSRDTVVSEKSNASQNIFKKMGDIVNPNLEQHRDITGSEMRIAYGLGFTPAEYSRLNDIPLNHVSNARISELLEKVSNVKNVDLSSTTVGEFFRQIDANNFPKDIKLADITGEKYIEYLANVINNETAELKRMFAGNNIEVWNKMKGQLAISELDENFGEFYSEMSKKFSLYARPTESVENWTMRVTKFAYNRGILSEVKQNLREIVSKN